MPRFCSTTWVKARMMTPIHALYASGFVTPFSASLPAILPPVSCSSSLPLCLSSSLTLLTAATRRALLLLSTLSPPSLPPPHTRHGGRRARHEEQAANSREPADTDGFDGGQDAGSGSAGEEVAGKIVAER